MEHLFARFIQQTKVGLDYSLLFTSGLLAADDTLELCYIFCDLSKMARFGKLSGPQIEQLVEDKDSKNTQRAIKQSANVFREFLIENGHNSNFEDFSEVELAAQLVTFWPNARSKKGVFYKKKTMQKYKFGIKRHMLKKKNVDIDEGLVFKRSNEVFLAALKDLKRKGFGSVIHKNVISVDDLKQLYSDRHPAFNVLTPSGLLSKVWFEIMLFFC